jgi:hypothetical protein
MASSSPMAASKSLTVESIRVSVSLQLSAFSHQLNANGSRLRALLDLTFQFAAMQCDVHALSQ